MTRTNENSPEKEPREEEQPASDFWSDEGGRRFNEALDEGGAYARVHGSVSHDPEDYLEDQECEYRDPELYDPDEETLSPGEMELIFENSYIM
jgi:hypothetical protein